MKNKLDYKEVFDVMKINIQDAVSMYKYAPVFKVKIDGDFYVLKRSKKDEMRFFKLVAYEKHLTHSGINVVNPKSWLGKESHVVNDERWVLYPYKEGEPYNGSESHIRQSGDLLGRIHKSSINTFNHGFTWTNYDDEFFGDVNEDMIGIEKKYGENQLIKSWVDSASKDRFSNLKEIEFPYVDGSWDYKGSNLIFSDDIAYIDPDNSGYIPRIFDLCLALLLFNTESSLAPDRVFTVKEWDLFMDAYKEHVELSSIEEELFYDFLQFVFVDEAMWAISDLEEDEPERQKNFMKNLLLVNYSQYKI